MQKKTLTVRTPGDLVATVPAAIGFHPTESVVMIAFGERQFVARADRPTNGEEEDALVQLLCEPAIRNSATSVALLFYSEHDCDELADDLVDAFVAVGIAAQIVLHVRGYSYRVHGTSDWNDVDVDAHPHMLQAAYDGRAPAESREARVAYVAPTGIGHTTVEEEALAGVMTPDGLDAVIASISRSNAGSILPIWTEIVRGCTAGTPELAQAAMVLSFAAWMQGDGALAWIAWDLTAGATGNWRHLVRVALEEAISPDVWEEDRLAQAN
jgi:hypothetical protein